MERHRVTLAIEGLLRNNGYVLLPDFLRQLQLLQGALGKIDRGLSREHKPTTVYKIVDLGLHSPARVVLEAEPRGTEDRREIIMSTLFGALGELERGAPPSNLDYDVLQDFKGIADPVGRSIAGVTLSQNGSTFDFTPRFRDTVARLLVPTSFGAGFLRGMLEAINVHGSANVFKIYPIVGPTSVACHFPESLKGAAIAAVGKNVQVRGLLKYRTGQPFAHEIDITDIDIIPTPEGDPLSDLRGIAPNLTGGLSSDDWLEKRRAEIEGHLEVLYGAK